jgi:short-subunit dehydrogenase
MKKAIITGATSGIGNELAKILAENGYKVGITGRRKTHLEKLQKSKPNKFSMSSFDCTTENNSEKLVELTSRLGGLDLLVLSSGRGDLNEDLDFEIENKTNLLNVNAFTEIVDWAFNYFQKQGKGHLVAISSR